MYTIRLPLDLSESEERFLSKCFYFGNKIHNTLVREVKERMDLLFKDQEYIAARKEYHDSDFSGKKKDELSKEQLKRKKQLTDLMQSKLEEYGLLSKHLDKYVSVMQKHCKNYISSHQAQAEVNAVYAGVKKVLHGDGKQIHFKRYNDYKCIKQKNRTAGVKILTWDSCQFMKKIFRIKPMPDTQYMHEVRANTNMLKDIVYSSLKRIEFNSGFRYYIIITLRGEAPKTVKLEKNRSRTGVDFGTSTIATVSETNVHLEELAPKSIDYEKQIRHLQRLVDHSMRVNNPSNYNKDGTIKKGKHKWHLTKRCKKLKRKIRVLFRKQSAYVAVSHNTFLNRLIAETSEFITEPMCYKPLQKKAKNTERSDKESTVKTKEGTEKQIRKYKRKKRFGRSIKNRSPGLMQSRLEQKAIQYDIPFFHIDRNKFRASQLHHDTGEYIKPKLSERTKMIDGHEVQRDLYSAFLICNTDDTLASVDFERCHALFPHFVEMHNELIKHMKESGKSMRSCFGF